MSAEFLQFLFSGITLGSTYALVGLGFSIIYNASHVINFAQGEFVMMGGMGTVFFLGLGLPLPLAILAAIMLTTMFGFALERFAIAPARGASVVTLIIITIGASIVMRGLVQVVWGKEFHALPSFSGDDPIHIGGATILPQSIWVLCITIILVIALRYFFEKTIFGKAIIATSLNRDAAMLMGINVRLVLFISFGLSAALGAAAGVLVAPITLTNFEAGIMLGLKGFCAAILGGLGNGMGAVAGGMIVGIAEAMGAGYWMSEYKDAVAFVLILLVLFFKPSGLFGGRGTERV